MRACRGWSGSGPIAAFFLSTVNLVFGSLGDKVPQEFIEDRTQVARRAVRRQGDVGGVAASSRPGPRPSRPASKRSSRATARNWLLGDSALPMSAPT